MGQIFTNNKTHFFKTVDSTGQAAGAAREKEEGGRVHIRIWKLPDCLNSARSAQCTAVAGGVVARISNCDGNIKQFIFKCHLEEIILFFIYFKMISFD